MMHTRTACLLAAAATTMSLGLTACGDDEASTTTGAGDGASEVTVYSGREEEYVGPLVKRFEKESGTKVNIRYGETAELAATIVEEGGRSPADVFFAQDAGGLGAVEKEGLFTKLPDSTLDAVPARFRSPDGAWVGTSGRARALAYDGRKVQDADLPASVYDLTRPEWKGKVGWAPTNASFQAFVTAMRKADGDDKARAWLEGMKANDAQAYEKNSLIRDAIGDGEVEVGLINHYYVLEAIEESGGNGADYPVKLHFFPGGDVGSLVNAAGAGILRSSENQDAAARFVDYVLSPEGQRYFAGEVKEYPLVSGVQADPALPELDSIQQPDVDLGDLDDLQGTLEMLQETKVL